MVDTPVQFDSAGAKRIVDTVRYIEGLPTNTDGNNHNKGSSSARLMWMKINSSTVIDANHWKYVVYQVYKDTTGYDGWALPTDYISSGNGFNASESAGTHTNAIPIDTIVLCRLEFNQDGTAEYWIIGEDSKLPIFLDVAITGSTARVGLSNQYSYAIAEVTQATGTWVTVEDGITGTAYNDCEGANTDILIFGQSTTSLPTGVESIAMQPIPSLPHVRVTMQLISGTLYYSFCIPNLITATCSGS